MARSAKGRHEGRPVVPRPTLLPVPDPARRWKSLTLAANAAFAGSRWVDAEPLYDDALAEADRLFDEAQAGSVHPQVDPAPMLVAATANAAENWLKLGRRERAGHALIRLNHRLCAAMEDAGCPRYFQEQCFLHLRPALAELMTGLPRAGWSEEDVAREAGAIQAAALRFIERNSPKH